MFGNKTLNHKKPSSAKKGGWRWFAGMVAGQVVGLSAAAVLAPPAVIIPALVVSMFLGGLLGGMVMTRKADRPVVEHARPVVYSPDLTYQPVDHSDSDLGDMTVGDDFNVAADGNAPEQKQEQKPQPKLAPTAPQIKPF